MIGMRKIVTVCGSLRFLKEMRQVAEQLALERSWVVLTPIPHVLDRELTAQEIQTLGEIHKAKIDLSDAIFVVNVGGYVGEAVKQEIEYAREKGKEIFYAETDI